MISFFHSDMVRVEYRRAQSVYAVSAGASAEPIDIPTRIGGDLVFADAMICHLLAWNRAAFHAMLHVCDIPFSMVDVSYQAYKISGKPQVTWVVVVIRNLIYLIAALIDEKVSSWVVRPGRATI